MFRSAAVVLLLLSSVCFGQNSIISNPGFETGTSPWAFYTNTVGTFNNASAGNGSPHSGHIMIGDAGTNVQLYQAGIALDANTQYRLSFTAHSNTGHDLSVSLLKHGSPYTNYGLNSYVCNLSTAWTNCSIDFTTSGFTGSVNDARFMFWLASYATAGDEYFIDDVALTTSQQQQPQPQPQPVVTEVPPWSRTLPSSERFQLVLNNEGVLDKETNLVWERAPSSAKRTWIDAIRTCWMRTTGSRMGWRLPTIEELASLVDITISSPGPALPPGHPFQNIQHGNIFSDVYWSVTTDVRSQFYPTQAWVLRPTEGQSATLGDQSKDSAFCWCVRSGHADTFYGSTAP